ncbi:MAG TPA: metallophosphoesterase [Polyangiaceae bacterium]|nr:metallophosphoesterase [Polyangiaceae bacterium]
MRLQLLSDVHLEFHRDAGRSFVDSLDPSGVDVLVLAGDIAVGAGIVSALSLFCERYPEARVVYVHGNHEFYGADRASVLGWTQDALEANANLTFLDSDVKVILGRRFLGGPLWFRDDPSSAKYKRAVADFGQITAFESWVYAENARLVALFEKELREGDIVVTHHLPSRHSIAPEFAQSPLNAFFVCDVEPLMLERSPALWLHGHTHASVDCRVGATRIVCNPFGYAQFELNPDFSERCVLDV